MSEEKKVGRINPFDEKLETHSSTGLGQNEVNYCDIKSKTVSANAVRVELGSIIITKSKKKRLRMKKAKLKQIEIQGEVDKSEKKIQYSVQLSETGTNVNNLVTNSSIPINNCSNNTALNLPNKNTNICIDKVVENSLNNQKPVSEPSKSNIQTLNMKTDNVTVKEKSREDVLSEREAKKLAKQNAKKKDKVDNVQQETGGHVNKDSKTSESCNNLIKIESSTNEKAVDVTNKSEVMKKKSVGTNDNDGTKSNVDKAQKSVITKPRPSGDVVDCGYAPTGDVVDGEIRFIMKPPVLYNFNEGVKHEKSRDDVMAEREAKKLAKMAKKQQTKEGPSVAVKENVPVQTKAVQESKKPETPSEKSKSDLRAERRAKQEAQRAAKEAQKQAAVAPPTIVEKKVVKKSPEVKKDVVKIEEKVPEFKQHKLFSHLCVEPEPLDLNTVVHPVIVELGKKYATRVISGSNARCVSLLHALKQVISDYRVTSTSDLNRGLEAELGAVGTYLARARPLSVSMTNSLRYLRSHLTQASQLPDDEAKKKLLESIDTFIREQVDVAGQAISNTVQKKISNGDVILTYGCSSLVWRCLKESYQAGKEFSVVVVDGGPWYEGRELLRRLAALSIPCTYLLIPAVGFAITKTSKVLLGAHALLANGYVMSRTGSAMIALTASAHSVPVLVCCETYKFCERVQADSFVYNELGAGDEGSLKGVKWLSPIYDITPPDLVTAVVTELAILPCTSVPVVLRVKPSDIHHAT